MIEQFSFFAFCQGLFLILISIFSSTKRKLINGYLLILISLLMIGLVGILGESFLNWHRHSKGLSEFSILFFGPTMFLFTQSVLSQKQFESKDVFHFIPGVVYSIIITFYYILAPEDMIQQRIDSGELIRTVRILVGVGLAVNLTYLMLSYFKYQELIDKIEDELSYQPNINFIRNFLMAIGASLMVWLFLYFYSFIDDPWLEIDMRRYIWLMIVFMVLFISYYQMVSPSVFNFKTIVRETKYANSKLSFQDLDNLKIELEKIMEVKKPYLNAKLLKSELAEMVRINAPELSRLLNERIGMSFFEYVNYHRIHEFIRLAKTPLIEEKTLIGLAQEAGFQSKSTFNKAFKKVMGCPPSVYLNDSYL